MTSTTHSDVCRDFEFGFVKNINHHLEVRRIAIIVLIIASSAMPLRAQSVADYAGEFLELGVGARSLALGGAGAAISEDATSGYWNPAALNALKYPTVTVMHESRFDGTVQYNYAALAFPIDARHSAAISVLNIGVNNILDTRNALVNLDNTGQLTPSNYLDYSKVTSFGNYDWVAILSFAGEVGGMGGLFPPGITGQSLSWGVNAKLIYRRLDPQTTGTGLGFDFATRYHVSDNFTLAAVGQDLTTTLLSYNTGTKELVSPTIKLGGAYTYHITSDGVHKILATSDIDLRFENRGDGSAQVYVGPASADFHEGIEYQFKDIFSLRAGYNDLQMWSAGVGIAIGKLRIDYAYLGANAQDQLGSTNRISVSFALENPKWKRAGE
jgi:hypothetical protein